MHPRAIRYRTHLHSCYVHDSKTAQDAVVVSEIVEDEHGVIEPNLRVIRDPEVKFWITQENNRNHTDKKEFEALSRLDEHRVLYRDKDRELFKALNGHYPRFLSPPMRRELYQNPFVYGANITVEALVAMRYKKDLLKANRTPHAPTTGFLDIEMSLLKSSEGKIPLIVLTVENRVYLAMKRSFMYQDHGQGNVEVTIADVEKAAHDHIDPLVRSIFADHTSATNDDLKDYTDRVPFRYHFFVGDTELAMITWIFDRAHEQGVSFIGVWNIGFDLPQIMRFLDESGVPMDRVFAHPLVRGTCYAHASWREDKRKVAHFTQKWHWLTATAMFQFVDAMALYSYIRMVDGKEASYALDDILKKHGLGGKLKIDKTKDLEGLQTEDWHREMLSRFFIEYAVYAMWDGIGLQILEWLNNDLTAMMLLGDTTPAKFFPNQTIRVTNTLYEDWLPDGTMGKKHGGHVLGTGVDVEGIKDDDLLTAGGAVLEPQNLVARGLCLFKEWPGHATRCYAWVSDVDFSAQYPSSIFVVNISKQSKIGTLIGITAPHVQLKYKPQQAVEVFCSYLNTPHGSGYDLGVEFFNLPTYEELDALVAERIYDMPY